MSAKRIFLIDGMSHIYRAYYAIRNLSNAKGLPTNAIFGFTSILRKLIQEHKPEYIGVALDLEGPTVRHEKYQAYKRTANRCRRILSSRSHISGGYARCFACRSSDMPDMKRMM